MDQIIGIVEHVQFTAGTPPRSVLYLRDTGHAGMLRCVAEGEVAEAAAMLRAGNQIAAMGTLKKFKDPRPPFNCSFRVTSLFVR